MPANSPAMRFQATEVWTENSTDSRPPRPKAADPRNRPAPAKIPGLVEPSGLEPESFDFKLSLEQSLNALTHSNEHGISEPCTEKTEQQVVKMSKSSKLRNMVSESRARPKAAHPGRRQLHNRHASENITHTTPVSTIEPPVATLSDKNGRPKGAHHRNHPMSMYIPGLEEESDDELEALLEATAQWRKNMNNKTDSQTKEESKYTFRPGNCSSLLFDFS